MFQVLAVILKLFYSKYVNLIEKAISGCCSCL